MHKYTIDKAAFIAEGGYSKIYKCQDVLGIRGVCKHIPKAKTSLEKFEREVMMMHQLSHSPKVVQLYDALENDDSYFLILEWCRGGSIQDYTSNHTLYSENTVASIVRGVLRGLVHVHRAGIVHRDIKPGNVLLTDKSPDAEVKLTDFGAALLCEAGGTVETKSTIGTPWYMAPETLRSIVAPETDIWSVGVMTYQLLTGVMPFEGSSMENIWRRVLVSDPLWNSERWSGISDDAKEFVKLCLDKELGNRPSAIQCLDNAWLKKTSCEDRFTGTSIELQPFKNANAGTWIMPDFTSI
jgi:calcium-dependent protein kinase